MEKLDNVIAAYSAEQAARLTGLSVGQLAEWDKIAFFPPEYAEANRRLPYSRAYSFRDIVGLKTLAVLRKDYRIGLSKLREVADKLAHITSRPWSELKLSVLKGDVVVVGPEGQGVAPRDGQIALIPLKSIIEDLRQKAIDLRQRSAETVGKVERSKFVLHNAQRISGTRIPVSAVKSYIEAGSSDTEIIKAYPDLTLADIAAVRQLDAA